MIIFSGIPAGTTGVGRLVAALQQQATQCLPADVRVLCRRPAGSFTRWLRRGQFAAAMSWLQQNRLHREAWTQYPRDDRVLQEQDVVLIHPQTLGPDWCGQLILRRTHPTWVFLMDAGYFCDRSYNVIPGTEESCLRCLEGQWQQARQFNCVTDKPGLPSPTQFLSDLQRWVRQGRVKLLVQNRLQAELARRHFGESATIKTIGLWAADFDDLTPPHGNTLSDTEQFHVVFHGAPNSAKGFPWALALAERCPRLRFLFPCSTRRTKRFRRDLPGNATFQSMQWESGLAARVAAAKMVLVPSLWSAPIEGALIKSIITARAVAVVDEPTAYVSELPDALVLRLPVDLQRAAEQLTTAVHRGWQPDPDGRNEWFEQFKRSNSNLLDKLVAACTDAQPDRAVA